MFSSGYSLSARCYRELLRKEGIGEEEDERIKLEEQRLQELEDVLKNTLEKLKAKEEAKGIEPEGRP